MENEKPLITIVGALSKQGRGAAETLLRSGRYQLFQACVRMQQKITQHSQRINPVFSCQNVAPET